MLKSIFGIFFSKSLRYTWSLRYETYGIVRKILILLLLTVLTASSIICEFVAFSLFKENAVLAICLCVVFIALGVIAFRFSLFYSSVALKMAIHGTVQTGLFAKKSKKDNNEKSESENIEQTTTETENQIDTKPKKYNTKGLDIVIGILGFVYAIGVVITLVTVLVKNIESLKQ